MSAVSVFMPFEFALAKHDSEAPLADASQTEILAASRYEFASGLAIQLQRPRFYTAEQVADLPRALAEDVEWDSELVSMCVSVSLSCLRGLGHLVQGLQRHLRKAGINVSMSTAGESSSVLDLVQAVEEGLRGLVQAGEMVSPCGERWGYRPAGSLSDALTKHGLWGIALRGALGEIMEKIGAEKAKKERMRITVQKRRAEESAKAERNRQSQRRKR